MCARLEIYFAGSTRKVSIVLVISIVMLVILVLCGLVLVYVAFPHRGEEIPAAPWLGQSMTKAVDAMPTLDEGPEHPTEPSQEPDQRGGAHARR